MSRTERNLLKDHLEDDERALRCKPLHEMVCTVQAWDSFVTTRVFGWAERQVQKAGERMLRKNFPWLPKDVLEIQTHARMSEDLRTIHIRAYAQRVTP